MAELRSTVTESRMSALCIQKQLFLLMELSSNANYIRRKGNHSFLHFTRCTVTLTLGEWIHDRPPVNEDQVKQYLFPHQPRISRFTARERIKELLFFVYYFLLGRCQEQSFYTSEGLPIHSVIQHHVSVPQDTQRWVRHGTFSWARSGGRDGIVNPQLQHGPMLRQICTKWHVVRNTKQLPRSAQGI